MRYPSIEVGLSLGFVSRIRSALLSFHPPSLPTPSGFQASDVSFAIPPSIPCAEPPRNENIPAKFPDGPFQ
jgi:hypothetical protein